MASHLERTGVIALLVVAGFVVIAGVVLTVVYGNSVSDIRRRRHQKRKPLEHVARSHISEESLSLLTHRFEDDEKTVHWADRQASIVFVLPAAFFLLVSVALLVVAGIVWTRVGTISHTFHNSKTGQTKDVRVTFLRYLAVVPVLLSLMVDAYIWNLWLLWRAFIRSITNLNTRVDIQPFAWAFWFWNNEKHDPQPLHRIERVEEQGTILGRILGYGTIRIITLRQESEDEETHDWHFVRRYEEVAEELRELCKEAKELMREPAPAPDDHSLELVRRLAEVAETHRELTTVLKEVAADKWGVDDSPMQDE